MKYSPFATSNISKIGQRKSVYLRSHGVDVKTLNDVKFQYPYLSLCQK